MKHLFGIICISLFLDFAGFSQDYKFPVKNYTTKDYGRDFHPVNMSILQDSRGLIYAANGFKLLEFDGHAWNSYPINRETWILSLAVDPSGIIFAGSQNEFGFFVPDLHAGLKYCSLSDSLEIKDLDFTNVWKVSSFSGGVAFQAEEKLFIFRDGKIKVINPSTSFHTSFAVNDKLYVRQREAGLMVFENDSLMLIGGSEIFKSVGIFMMVPFGENGNEILIGTREKGFWVFDPGSAVKFCRFVIKDQAMIDGAVINGGVRLNTGAIALNTANNGVIIMDTAGNIISVINEESGLSDNDVKQVIEDNNRNLWLALNIGISTIEYSSPLSFISEESGLEGAVNSVLRYRGRLYAGTDAGLFAEEKIQDSPGHFSLVADLSVPVRSLAEADGLLIAGTDAGIWAIQGNSRFKVSGEASFSLCWSDPLRLLLSGGSSGLSVFSKNNAFRKIYLPEEFRSDIIAVTAGTGINDSAIFLIGTRYEGAARLIFRNNSRVNIDRYNKSDGVPEGPVIPFNYGNEILFGTSIGLYRFVGEKTVRESLPDSLKNNPSFLRGMFTPSRISDEKTVTSVSILVDKPERIWVCTDNHPGFLDKNNNNRFIRMPFMGIDAGKINTIFPEATGICWFGTTDGLFRYDVSNKKDYNAGYLSLIRRVATIPEDTLLFNGVCFISGESGFKITNVQPESMKSVLAYRNNSVRFDFSASFFEYPEKILFAGRLEGYDTAWTNPEYKYYQEYTNLHEGEYTFHVRAKNVYGVDGTEALYSFTVLPPWYRSLAAYVCYAIASMLMVWLIVSLYSIRLKRENVRLEGIVRERTSEIVRQKDVLEHQKMEIEDSIRYACRIQTAVLPADHDFTALIPESFVFYRPRDIVSGDFYWISRVGNKLILSGADCTGHGVPGAFMSMLGVAFLNEIVNKDHITNPSEILNRLREKVIGALQQRGISGEASDGMDIVVICIEEENNRLLYSGAYNPLIMIRNGQISEFHADRMPIAIFDTMKRFVVNEIPVMKGDMFYFYSDGYQDQFGGPEGRKFKSRRFKQLLAEISAMPVKDQKDIIEKTFDEWKGEMNQVDDIVVIGVRI